MVRFQPHPQIFGKGSNVKIILVMVMSADGKTTKWYDPKIYPWTSKEDQTHFFSLITKNSAVIMGRKTYSAAKPQIKLSSNTLRLVLTKTPEKFAQQTVTGQLEFTNATPQELVKRLKEKGCKQALLVGGEEINTLFFKAKLVNELWLTIEPAIFGSGNSLVAKAQLDTTMQLKSLKKLNATGTILLKYLITN